MTDARVPLIPLLPPLSLFLSLSHPLLDPLVERGPLIFRLSAIADPCHPPPSPRVILVSKTRPCPVFAINRRSKGNKVTGMKADLSFIKRERMKVAVSHGSINLESIGRVKVGRWTAWRRTRARGVIDSIGRGEEG